MRKLAIHKSKRRDLPNGQVTPFYQGKPETGVVTGLLQGKPETGAETGSLLGKW